MKGRDLQIILLVAVISGIASVLLTDVFFSSEADRSQKVETAEKITTNFDRPDDLYFNANSFNPAQQIQIGQDPGSNPFQGR
mgnify:CR=1 FL=1